MITLTAALLRVLRAWPEPFSLVVILLIGGATGYFSAIGLLWPSLIRGLMSTLKSVHLHSRASAP
jgi:hypothetical protein